jgi:thiol-disulfide isomerase/thioredoxin
MSAVQAPARIWLDSLEEAMRQSRGSGKPVFLDFFSPTCAGCEAMETVTYPDHEVQEFLGDHFTPARLDVDQASEAARRYNPIWTPTLLVLNEEGAEGPLPVEAHRVVGYLPPEEFRAELNLGLAKAHLAREALENAMIHFRETVTHFPETWAAPEAQYWAGVTRYKAEGKLDGLRAEWNFLIERWPESRWARSASFIRLAQG